MLYTRVQGPINETTAGGTAAKGSAAIFIFPSHHGRGQRNPLKSNREKNPGKDEGKYDGMRQD